MPSSKPRALSRDIILSAALELVDEEGLSALSLRSLGKRLGVSQAAFYRHIPDKAALLEGISEQVWRLTFNSFLARVEGGKVDVPGRSESTASSEVTHAARLSPAYWANSAINKVSLDGLGFTDIAPQIGALLGFFAAFAALALIKFRYHKE